MVKWLLTALIVLGTFISVNALGANGFNPEQANKTLEKLTIRLSTQELNINKLKEAVDTLTDLRRQARACVEESKAELEDVNRKIKAIGELTTKTEEQVYLEKKKQNLETLMSQCRLFDIRVTDVIQAFSDTIQKELTSELLANSDPIWKNIAELPAVLPTINDTFSLKKFMERSGLNTLSAHHYLIAFFLAVFGFGAGALARRILGDPVEFDPSTELIVQIKYDLFSVLYRYFIYIIPTLFVTGYAYILFLDSEPMPYLLTLALTCTAYQLIIMALRFFICPPNNKFSINTLPNSIARKIVQQFRVIGMIIVLANILYAVIIDQSIPEQFYYLVKTLFIVIFSANIMYMVWQVNQLPALVYKYQGLRWLLSMILFTTFIGVLAAAVLGYHNLAEHVLVSILLTVMLFIVIWFINAICRHAIDNLREGKSAFQQKVHYFLGMRKNESLTELIWLQMVVYLILWGGFLGLLLNIWGLSEANEMLVFDMLVHGFIIAGYEIRPANIIIALLFFTVLVLVTRFARGYFLRHTRIVSDTSARFALSTIVGYIGFITAVIVSLLIAGVDFTGIAIIAGALSVGVGFGLQNIVSNFLSGLILLVERPIKMGDRIIVGTTEGYVRKISIRSTRIRTQNRIDVIVPNSELISQQVTNLMFNDRLLRVIIPVGVAYGSDTELVRKLLVQVAQEHPDVTDQEGHKPKALFRAFGTSTLDFELWCVLLDADKLNDVPSDLHFAIDKLFREHNVEIAFPQQDIRIKEMPKDL